VREEGPERRQLVSAVERARRRALANQALWELTLAATIALVGPTLFLALGKDLFAWPILTVFVAGGLSYAAWRFWRRRPDRYAVSQLLDARLATADQISTAIYYLESSDPVAVEQRRAAAEITERMDPAAAFPFTVPRSLYALASVFVVASALCALRYFLEKPLRVEKPLPQVVLQAMRRGEPQEQDRRREVAKEGRDAGQKQENALTLESQEPGNRGNPQQAKDNSDPVANSAPEAGDRNRSGEEKAAQAQNENADAGAPSGDPMASDAENNPIQSYEDMLERDAKSGLAKAEGKQGNDSKENPGERRPAGSQDGANSLLAKLRDAMNNMLSRLQQKPAGTGQNEQPAGGSPNRDGEQKEGAGQGRGGFGQPKSGGQQAAEGEGNEGDSQDMAAHNSSGKDGGKSSDQSARGQSGSGAGKQEGDKRILEAQQQEAMGKLSELYGKRAANVTGEVTVETQAGKQTLKTPQSDRQARHADTGGEISRDEIPLAYQAYVKEYFSRLRQGAGGSPQK
jgi:hypothetical protein